jgi:hypothetical protein
MSGFQPTRLYVPRVNRNWDSCQRQEEETSSIHTQSYQDCFVL